MNRTPSAPSRAPRIRRGRAIAGLLAAALAAGVLVAGQPVAARAADATPMLDTYRGEVHGDYVMIGNGSLVATEAVTGSASPSQLHDGAPGAYNDDFAMRHVQQAPALERAGAANSSIATLEIPAGASIVHATLAWSGNTGRVDGREGFCSTRDLPAVIPQGSVGDGSAMVQIGDGPVARVRGAVTTDAARIGYYSARADVTALFQGVALGSPQRVAVGDLWLPEGPNCFGGWTMALVYDFGRSVPGVVESAVRDVTLSHGHVRIDAGAETLLPYRGFRVASDGVRASLALGEGDAAIRGDYAEYRAGATGPFARIPGATRATDNIGTGHAASGVRFQGAGAQRFHNASIDVVDAALPLVPAGSSEVQLRLGTDSDAFLLQAAAFSAPVAALELAPADAADPDVRVVLPGERAVLSFTVRNSGSAPIVGARVEAPLAAECERELPVLAPGAEHAFTCQADAVGAEGATIVVTVRAAAGGETVTAEHETTLQASAIAIERIGEVAVAAGTARTVLEVRNAGSSTLVDVAAHPSGRCVRDASIDWSTSSEASTPAGTLGPGETVRATASCTLAQLPPDGAAGVRVQGLDAAGNAVEDALDLTAALLAVAPAPESPSQPAPSQPAPSQPAPSQPAPESPSQPAPTEPRPDPAPAVPRPPAQPAASDPAPPRPAPADARPTPPQTGPTAQRPSAPAAQPATQPSPANAPTPTPAAAQQQAPTHDALLEALRRALAARDLGEISSSVDSYVVTAVNTGSTPLVDVSLGGVPAALGQFASGWLDSVAALAPGESVTTSAIAGMPASDAARSGAVVPGWGSIVPPLGAMLSALALLLALLAARRRRRA